MNLNYKRTILVGLAFLSISCFWQFYDNIIPLILKETFHMKETLTGAIMALDNILALFMLPAFGVLSDKTNTKLGKRMPYILVGTLFSTALLLLLIYADKVQNLALFIGVLLCLLIAMGTYRSPAVSLMPDLTPAPLRSSANAVINLMGTLGAVYTLVMIKVLVKTPEDGSLTNYFPLGLSIAVFMLAAVLVLLLTIRERKLAAKMEEETKAYDATAEPGCVADAAKAASVKDADASTDIADSAAPHKMPADVKRSLIFLLLSVFFWFAAYNAVTTAFSRYATIVWGMENGGYASCLMVATLAAVASYLPIGWISSRIGRKKTILAGVVIMCACYLTGAFVFTFHGWINVMFAILGCGWAAINVNSYPMVVEMSKAGDIGKFTGTYYTFSMAAQVFTPILSGVLLEHISYKTLFPYAFCFSCLAFCTMSMVRHGDSRPTMKKNKLEAFDVDD